VNDYLSPPKVTKKNELGLERILAVTRLTCPCFLPPTRTSCSRSWKCSRLSDCAEMAARARLISPAESALGPVHYRVDYPTATTREWVLPQPSVKDADGIWRRASVQSPTYIVPLGEERMPYNKMRRKKVANA